MDTMLDQSWRLSPAVALRPEPFGALAYHFGNRRLTFLKPPERKVFYGSGADLLARRHGRDAGCPAWQVDTRAATNPSQSPGPTGPNRR